MNYPEPPPNSDRDEAVAGWRQELQWLLLAVQFYTRLPVRLLLPYREQDLNRASRFISLVGWLVAIPAALTMALGFTWYGPWGGAVLAILTGVIVTGAFHEDGLADAVDGFGGGLNQAHILEIMKDSRVGTYGALALVFAVLLKVVLLAQLQLFQAMLLLWVVHAGSRALAISLLLDLPYVQADQRSKVKPIAKSIEPQDVWLALATGIMPMLFLPWQTILSLLLGLGLLRWCSRHYLQSRLGGYTGDCLGAVQQLAELLIYLLVVAQTAH